MSIARKSTMPLDRRRFRKAAGVCLALPMLESLAPLAQAAATRKKPVKRIEPTDRGEVEQMVRQLREKNGGLRDLVHLVVASRAFATK